MIYFVQYCMYDCRRKVPTGRLRKTTARDDTRITRLSKVDPLKSARAIKNELDLPVSSRTVQRRLVENNLKGRKLINNKD